MNLLSLVSSHITTVASAHAVSPTIAACIFFLRPVETVFAGVCILWWCVTLVVQFSNAFATSLRAADILGLLPGYRFFAPAPRFVDYLIEYRTTSTDHAESQWKPMNAPASRSIATAFWNPSKLSDMAVRHWSTRVIAAQSKHGPDAIQDGVVYRQLLSFIQRDASDLAGACTLQFQVRAFSPIANEGPHQAFRSAWHQVSR